MNRKKEVDKVVEKLKKYSFNELERELIEKRLKWFEKNKNKLKLEGNDVEKALQILLLKTEIDKKDIEIIEKTERKIVWRSFNFCPVIEACKELNLDTREVCKKIYEKSIQVFIEKLNQNLKFGRNYQKIRPYCDYCEEWVELKK